jgi:hypothetical protein
MLCEGELVIILKEEQGHNVLVGFSSDLMGLTASMGRSLSTAGKREKVI